MFSARDRSKPDPDAESASAAARPTRDIANTNPRWNTLALQPMVAHRQLAVSESGHDHEREAERVANDAMTPASNGVVAATSARGVDVPHSTGVSRSPRTAPPSVHSALQSPGHPLDRSTQLFMQSRFGDDFSGVRVHNTPEAARANDALQSRAFTSGHNIAFAAGQYAPGTNAGRDLIAHELAHVEQQSLATGADANTVRRAPALSGHKTTELIDESIAGNVDAALAASATLKKYIDTKSLKKISGHVSVDDPKVFEYRYAKYAKSHSDMPDVKDVPGYTDRANNSIELKQRSATLEVIIHEAVHFNSSEAFASAFGHAMNEGITEYFTEAILGEQKLGSGRAYRAELKLATAFVTSVGEEAAAKAYFHGDRSAQSTSLSALNKVNSYSKWRAAVMSDKEANWVQAAQLLTAAMGR